MLASVAEKMSLDLSDRTTLKTGFLKTTGKVCKDHAGRPHKLAFCQWALVGGH